MYVEWTGIRAGRRRRAIGNQIGLMMMSWLPPIVILPLPITTIRRCDHDAMSGRRLVLHLHRRRWHEKRVQAELDEQTNSIELLSISTVCLNSRRSGSITSDVQTIADIEVQYKSKTSIRRRRKSSPVLASGTLRASYGRTWPSPKLPSQGVIVL
jgi:hypothetical protein